MKEFETIEFELKDKVAYVWLNRPEVRNAFNNIMLTELIECVEEINNIEEARVVVLQGRKNMFCSGADLNWMRGVANYTYEENYNDSLTLSKCFYAIYTCKKPTIAVVRGAAIGGANGLIAACDFAYCADDTVFSLVNAV